MALIIAKSGWGCSVRRAVALLPLLLLLHLAQSQSPVLERLQTALQNHQTATSQEKVFLHTDKDFYLAGETLWFKAYVVHATTHRPFSLSKVLYVELVNSEDIVALQASVTLKNGLGNGYLTLPSSLPTGSYYLRSYTAWMKNFDPAFVFKQQVRVINTSRRPNWSVLEKTPSFSARFFPEGGNMVAGVEGKVGFQLLNAYGEGVAGSGVVVDGAGDTVARFETGHAGTGSFLLAPKKGLAYEAIIRLASGERFSSTLPAVLDEGYTLRVMEGAGDEWHITAGRTGSGVETLYLLGHTRGERRFAAAQTIATGRAEWRMSKAQLGDGVSTFILFDGNGQPRCERLVFKRPTQGMRVAVQCSALSLPTRSKMRLELATTANNGQPVSANLSLSVFRLDSLQGIGEQVIDEYLWLSSDLRGRIQSPTYYFEKDDAERAAALDNLMLTQGWRRFKWEDVVAGSPKRPTFLPEYEGPVVYATVRSKQTGLPVEGVLAYLTVPGERFSVSNSVSNARGEMAFVLPKAYAPVDVALQAAGADSTLRLELQPAPWSPPLDTAWTHLALDQKWKAQLERRHLDLGLATAFPPADDGWRSPFGADTLPFFGRPDRQYLLDEYTRFPDMETILREVIPETRLSKRDGRFSLTVLNLPYQNHFENGPLVMVDGLPLFDVDKLLALDPLKVKSMDVVARKFFWGNTVNNGILSLRTYEGDLGGLPLGSGVTLFSYNGLQVPREFYSPDYAYPAAQARQPDRRNVLLWAPTVSTKADGKAVVEFYTSDLPGRYAVCVQGISKEGLAGSKVVMMDVR